MDFRKLILHNKSLKVIKTEMKYVNTTHGKHADEHGIEECKTSALFIINEIISELYTLLKMNTSFLNFHKRI